MYVADGVGANAGGKKQKLKNSCVSTGVWISESFGVIGPLERRCARASGFMFYLLDIDMAYR